MTKSEMYRSARADADRLRRLQEVTAAFSEAPTVRDVVHVLVNQAHEALRADRAMVMLLDEEKQELALASSIGYPPEVVDRWSTFSLDSNAPLTDAIRTGEPLFFSTHEGVTDRYPALARHRYSDDDALAAIPLTSKARAFGAIAIVFRRPHRFSEAERAFIVSLTRHSAQAIDRARLLEAERSARQEAEFARQEAETANGLKDEFLATMSHELRTPLNAVMGWVTLLRAKTTDSAMASRAIDAIDRNARTQARLVEDALDVSRIISGKLQLDMATVDLGSVVVAAVDVVRAAADARRIELALAIDHCMIAADAARLQQIVWNLVSNAVKFTPEGGRVAVSVHRSGPTATIEVRDTGVGITREFLPHVFERFRQFDGSITRAYGGLGLGLAIVRHLAELHGATVVAESDGVGKGSSFRVDFPVKEVSPSVPKEEHPSSPQLAISRLAMHDLKGLRLLVVDDDDDSREVLCAALEHCGAEVFSAPSADSAMAQADSVRPNILVCDIGMPGTDGYALLREWRALPGGEGKSTLAIAVTGFAGSQDARRARDAGFHVHLAKPVDLERFTETVAKLAGRSST